MSRKLVVLMVSAFVLVRVEKVSSSENKPYNVEFEKVQSLQDSDPNWIKYETLRLTKIGKNEFSISGKFTLLKSLGNDEIVGYSVYKRNTVTGQYNSQPVLTNAKPTCDFVSSETLIYPSIVERSNFPPVDKACPFPKGTYTIDNYVVTSDKLPKFLPPGEYKAVIFVMKNNKMVIGYNVLAKVISNV